MEKSLIKGILVVDDEAQYREMVQDFFHRFGYECDAAASANEALERLCVQQFDLVISDIRMTGKDGLELMQEAEEAYPHLEFILMTGHALITSPC